MRSIAAVAITAFACGAVAAGAGTAHADTSGACLVINNRAADYFDSIYIEPVNVADVKWKAFPWQAVLIQLRGKPLTTPSGSFTVTVESDVPVHKAWSYQPDRNRSLGCNGSWVVTLTE
ncbi:hypothetical protein GFY24_39070 [Nocardia sp. SYP-A9097]|uniref:hypothetical protein n=1 Tax=Nocardia sp. SYP-A9097 TaxID=2663237 RepID=UPI00129AD10A|nr:hypothetical protein [Nocardia sp. SYP-A9097]MRH93352.1 hypothetical protein [Nocardia sp. SYP-A9097]